MLVGKRSTWMFDRNAYDCIAHRDSILAYDSNNNNISTDSNSIMSDWLYVCIVLSILLCMRISFEFVYTNSYELSCDLTNGNNNTR